ncbi:MAG: carbohydrate ABC transporter permease [Spirochaetales bacterium]
MKKYHISTKQRNIYLNTVAILIAAIFLFPLYWILINSFKIDSEVFRNPPTFWPEIFTLQAYTEQIGIMVRPFINSTVIAVSSMMISLTLALPAAYGLARYSLPQSKFFLLTFLVTQMLPASLVLTPLFLIFSGLGILNNYLSPIFATATVSIPFIVLLLRPNFLSVPRELEDSAKIDGCTPFGSFVRIIIPATKPGIITAACFAFVMAWNDLVYSMTFNTKEAMRPMTAGIYSFMNQYGTQWNKIMAYGILLILPTCILFVTMQKYIVSGLVSGSVKG